MTYAEGQIVKNILILLFLCVVYQLFRTILAGANTLEYSFSSIRIFVEIIIFLTVFSYFKKTPSYIINIAMYFLIFNSIVIIFSSLSDLSFGTQITSYFRSMTGEPQELFRFSGLVGHFQLPAFLFSLFLVFGQKYITYKFILINILAGLFLSRSLLFFNFLILAFKYPKIFLLVFSTMIIFAFAINFLGASDIITVFFEYFKKRLLIFSGGIAADYSAKDTLSTYWLFDYYSNDLTKLMFGEHVERFSSRGGRDPYYTRWLVGGGLVVLLFLEIIKIKLIYLITKDSTINFILGISLFTFSDLKGDMTLTTYIIPLLLSFIFTGILDRAKN